jgi:hypothetical protein
MEIWEIYGNIAGFQVETNKGLQPTPILSLTFLDLLYSDKSIPETTTTAT